MDKNRNEAAPPGRIKLGERDWLVAQPTDQDMQAVGLFIQKRVKSPLAQLVEDPGWGKLTEKQQDKLLAERTGEPSSQQMVEILSGMEGCRFLAWLLIRKQHPDVVKERDIDPHITDQNAEVRFVELDEASGMMSMPPNSGGRSGSGKGQTGENCTRIGSKSTA